MSTTGVPVGRPSCSDSLGSGIRERRSSRNRTGAFLEDRSALIVEIGKKLAEHLARIPALELRSWRGAMMGLEPRAISLGSLWRCLRLTCRACDLGVTGFIFHD